MQQVTIPTSIHQVTVQPSALYPSIHVSCMAPECTAISLAVARFTSVAAAKAHDTCEMYSVAIVSLGAELCQPSTRLMFNSSHNINKTFPNQMFRYQVCGIDCASDLLNPELLAFSFCSGQKYFVSICLIAPLPLRRASPRAVAVSVQIRT